MLETLWDAGIYKGAKVHKDVGISKGSESSREYQGPKRVLGA